MADETNGSRGVEIKYEKPPVQVSKTGVHSINPADILRSRVGREAIEKAADFWRGVKRTTPTPLK